MYTFNLVVKWETLWGMNGSWSKRHRGQWFRYGSLSPRLVRMELFWLNIVRNIHKSGDVEWGPFPQHADLVTLEYNNNYNNIIKSLCTCLFWLLVSKQTNKQTKNRQASRQTRIWVWFLRQTYLVMLNSETITSFCTMPGSLKSQKMLYFFS